MYLYSQEVNITMKQVQEDLISFIVQDSGVDWNITNLFLEYVERKTSHLNYNGDIPIYITDEAINYGNITSRKRRSLPPPPPPLPPLPLNDEKWGYVKSMLKIYSTLITTPQDFFWSMKNIGSMLVKSTLLYNRYENYEPKM